MKVTLVVLVIVILVREKVNHQVLTWADSLTILGSVSTHVPDNALESNKFVNKQTEVKNVGILSMDRMCNSFICFLSVSFDHQSGSNLAKRCI